MTERTRLVTLGPLPPELRRRLEADYALDAFDTGGEAKPGYRVAVTTSLAGATAETMAALPDLGLIACNGTGTEQIDLGAAAARGIVVRNTPEAVTDCTADFAIGLIFAVTRRIAEGDRFVRAGRWGPERMAPTRRVSSMTAGIVGLGRIGSAVAARAAGLGMGVLYTGPREKQVPYRFMPDISGLAGAVDVLVLTCPGGEATRHVVNADVLDALGADGHVVNVSRGSVVDDAALVAALTAGTIAGAGLDVFEGEPDLDPRYLDLDNVVLTPHIAAVTEESRRDIAATLHGAIGDFLAGRPVPDAAVDWRASAR
jgi:lactate dehydrogenase-like 2-hydroxyacid dehydrogenase